MINSQGLESCHSLGGIYMKLKNVSFFKYFLLRDNTRRMLRSIKCQFLNKEKRKGKIDEIISLKSRKNANQLLN